MDVNDKFQGWILDYTAFDRVQLNKLKRPIWSGSWNITSDVDKCSKVKVKLSLYLTKHHAMKTYWGVDV
jgi:hypothetical protein